MFLRFRWLAVLAILIPAARGDTIAYWRFEDRSGQMVADVSGNDNTGLLSGGVTFSNLVPFSTVPQTGATDQYSLVFDGTGAVTIPDSSSLRPNSGFTAEAWIYTPAGGWVILGKQFQGGYNNSFQLEIRPEGLLRFQLTDTANRASIITAPRPTLNSWHHVAGEWDGSSMRLLLDGVEVAAAPFAGPIGYDANSVLIGADNDAVLGGGPACCFLVGLIDEVRLSDVALRPQSHDHAPPKPDTLW